MAAAAALPALLALLGAAWLPGPAAGMQVWVSNPNTVALLFQPVVLRCSYQSTASAPPIVTWKYKSFCSSTSAFSAGGGSSSAAPSSSQDWDAASACPDASRTVRIVATKQGNAVTLGDFYQGRSVTITDGAELSLGPAAWGDSGVYICTVTSAQDLEGNNEAVAELVVLASLPEPPLPGTQSDWLFVVLVLLGAALVALVLGLCWCQCCPHTCCCFVRCPCCPQRCCCPEALYLAGKAATSGASSVYYAAPLKGPPPPAIALGPIGNGYSYSGASVSGHSSQVPLLRDTDSHLGSVPAAPPAAPPSMRVLRYLEDELNAFEPHGRYPPSGAGAPSDISSLHEAPDAWAPRGRPVSPPRSHSPPRGRWHSVEDLGSSRGGSPPPSRPRSRSRDDLLGGAAPLPRLPPVGPPGPPRRLRKNDAMSRESLVV